MHTPQSASLGLIVDGTDKSATSMLLFKFRSCLLCFRASCRDLLRQLVHLASHLPQPLFRFCHELCALSLQICGVLGLLLPGFQSLAAFGVFPLDLLNLLSHLGRLLSQKLCLSLRNFDNLPHVCQALLQWDKLSLLLLLQGPQLLSLTLEAFVDLLQLLCQACLVTFRTLKLLLSDWRVFSQLLRICHKLLGHLCLLLGCQLQFLELLLLKCDVLRQLHVQALKLLEVRRILVHLHLDLVVVLEVGVVLALNHLHLLLIDLHSFTVLLHVGLQHFVLLLEAGQVCMAAKCLRLCDEGLQLQPLRLCIHPGLCLAAWAVKSLALTLRDPQAVQLLLSLLCQLLHNPLSLLNGLDMAVGANDVLKVLQQAILMR
mmetsp:Transcript_100675/g.293402  ORF Transcript_100675/g.293402 Transcript_100675/m.293402 type:complete len:373 (-) Transcript_100675:327-1445(-)